MFGPNPNLRPVSAGGQGDTARSNNWTSPKSVRVPPLGVARILAPGLSALDPHLLEGVDAPSSLSSSWRYFEKALDDFMHAQLEGAEVMLWNRSNSPAKRFSSRRRVALGKRAPRSLRALIEMWFRGFRTRGQR